MGCAQSVPATIAQPETSGALQEKLKSLEKAKSLESQNSGTIKAEPASQADGAASDAQKRRSKKSRARRLSYVDHRSDGDVNVQATDTAAQVTEDMDPKQVSQSEQAVKRRSKMARKRRLSYAVDEKEGKIEEKLAATAKEAGPAPEAFTPEQAKVKQLLELGGSITDEPADSVKRVVCSSACISQAGREPGFKKTNQDNCFSFEKFAQAGQSLFGAFDGHGPAGHTISGYVKQHLPVLLVECLEQESHNVGQALKKCFLDLDKAMNSTQIDCEFSGSTACVALVRSRSLNVAWVGDSRGVLGQKTAAGSYTAVAMTTDHKPTSATEKERILASSGRVERLVDESGQPIGPFRVWLQYAWIPGLAMSRALGDALAHQVGVTSEPEIFTHTLSPKDAFIILASDGVWEFVNSQDAVNIVGAASTAEDGCRQLVDEAFQRWLVEEEGVVDDITAVVVRFSYPE